MQTKVINLQKKRDLPYIHIQEQHITAKKNWYHSNDKIRRCCRKSDKNQVVLTSVPSAPGGHIP